MEIIAIRGVMTAPQIIDTSGAGLVILDEADIVRLDPDKMFTPTPAVADACRKLLAQQP